MIRTFVINTLVALALFASVASFAHQQKAAVTKVLFNPRTENIEVMHRFYVHDAEHAVKHIFGKNADILTSTQTQDQFAQYVRDRFSILDTNNNQLVLTPVGHEVDGKFFWVYTETPQSVDLNGMKVKHAAMRDIWSEQTNMVNIEGVGKTKTLTFEGNVEVLEVTF